MTIDERLDRLTERHEALTQTVELIAAMQIRNDERMGHLAETVDSLTARMDTLAETVGSLSARMDTLAERTTQLMDTMNRLGNIIISHEERIERLEDRQ